MNTQKLLKIIALIVGFAVGWLCAGNADAYTIRAVRSLNAQGAATPGLGFTTQANPFYVPGGGLFWNVVIKLTANAQIAYQIEQLMTDGAWVIVAGPYSTVGGTSAQGPVANQITYSFRGPFADLRVNETARTGGTITADIYVNY